MMHQETGKNIKSGLLIAFEGIDGTGKSTQIQLLAKKLRALEYEVVMTKEPTDGPVGQRIRKLYASRENVSQEEELQLFLADRRQHVTEVIAPALTAGKMVLTDRYYLSTAAYQGAAGLDPNEIIKRNEIFAPIPDIAFILDIPVSLGIKRIQTLRGEILNAFEQESELQKVAIIFNGLDLPYIKRIDGAQNISDVQQSIWKEVERLLFKRDSIERTAAVGSVKI
jgi:dTMP kinase